METLLKKREILRDQDGRFLQHGQGLIKKAQKGPKKVNHLVEHQYQPGHNKPGPGRPKGSKAKIPLALKEMILQALDEAGGVRYLQTLAVENSSAFAGLIAKVLPTTLQASESAGGPPVVEFRRIIVYPGGREEIEGVTPKALPAPIEGPADPVAHMLPSDDDPDKGPINSNDL